LEYQKEELVYLIYVQEGHNPPLFRPWNFDNKAESLFQFQLALLCDVFHVFCVFLTSLNFLLCVGTLIISFKF
jgi:hypothetical protein